MIAGRYALEREIGRGGTGPVWLGRDDVLGRQVALKRIGFLPGAAETDVDRAEREARLSARLHHPHVVAVFDVVTDPDTHDHWLVMEYVEGETLSEWVRDRGPLAPDAAAPLLWQVADALVAAHAAGITHRDVKPSNVLVGRDGQAKLTDFGIARIATDASLTQTGLVTGSPAYLAPEVASGGRGGAASDVWSLGATAYHVLAGRPPYDVGDNVLSAMYRIVHDEPPRLPEAGRLAPLLEGTMVRDPAQRWSMQQVRDFLAGSGRTPAPVPAPPTPDGSLEDAGGTRVLTAVTAAPEPAEPEPAARPLVPPSAPTAAPALTDDAPQTVGGPASTTSRRPSNRVIAGLGVAAALLLAVVLYAALSNGSGSDGGTHASGTPTGRATKTAAKPTAAGMESFIRDYVRTVSDNPDQAWTMLTPKFQRESGGIDRYRSFWNPATNGTVRDITADPAALTVSYQVHFDHFHNGPGPTVLDLTFQDGHYLIDGERTKGFVPAG
ncbi:serine/threonine-protein kinase [Nocardioides pocheonensis]|uniref:non-specific serine/threonine protein kinase n=1 Tax=Nocardioides pocheonensis TaxID=661485 RepID=A0A3N0GJQ6_9ACTN|nr:serine/threonine-protein kinase [Nocardioides pocheonensis]RNM12683.1 serine/threonine protein kinase [Nocardioides pocheonensis]